MFDVIGGWVTEKLGVKALGANIMFVISLVILIVVFGGYAYFKFVE